MLELRGAQRKSVSPQKGKTSPRLKGGGLGQTMTPQRLAEFMVGLLQSPTSSTVLEPGCGDGAFLEQLAKSGFRDVHGIDIDPALAARARLKSAARVSVADFIDYSPAFTPRVIIGNPPYVRRKDMPPGLRGKLDALSDAKVNGLSDLAYLFIKKSIDLLPMGGELVFVTPVYWTQALHGRGVRAQVSRAGSLTHLFYFGENRVFPRVNVHTVVFRFVKGERLPLRYVEFFGKHQSLDDMLLAAHTATELERRPNPSHFAFECRQPNTDKSWTFEPPEVRRKLEQMVRSASRADFSVVPDGSDTPLDLSILDLRPVDAYDRRDSRVARGRVIRVAGKPYTMPRKERALDEAHEELPRWLTLHDLFEIGPGMVSGCDEAFRVTDQFVDGLPREEHEFLVRVVKGADTQPFRVSRLTTYLRADSISTEEELKLRAPTIWRHLDAFRTRLNARFGYKGVEWFHWSFPRNEDIFVENPGNKFFVPSKDRRPRPRFAAIAEPCLGTQDSCVLVPRAIARRESDDFLLAILNSSTVDFWLQWRGIRRGHVRQYSNESLEGIPVRLVDWRDRSEIATHDRLTRLAQQARETGEPQQREIDELVQTLYFGEPSALRPDDFPRTLGAV
ncbi:MAG: Eco57I restriction-modification methylase domain-containing protein [Thermoplasmatota archaeon]